MATQRTIGGDGSVFIGEDKRLTFALVSRIDGSAVNMDAWQLLFDVRHTDTSPTFILEKQPVVVGVFDPDPALNTQRAVVQLDDDDTNLFKAQRYRYSLKRMTDGVETVLFFGDFLPQKATAP